MTSTQTTTVRCDVPGGFGFATLDRFSPLVSTCYNGSLIITYPYANESPQAHAKRHRYVVRAELVLTGQARICDNAAVKED